jgi:RNA polymerase sigma-70 factor (ECF subfamily)
MRERHVKPHPTTPFEDPGRPSTRTTALLVEKARAGDREAYDRLFVLAAEPALLFIRLRLGRKLRRKLDSMDILQESYMEAHKAFASFEYTGDQAFSRWLCRIIENRIRDAAEFHGAKKRREPTGMGHVSQVIERVRASITGPSTAAARAESQERLARAIEGLEEDEREAILLRHFQDLTVDEIARAMGRSPSAVRRLLGRALQRLGKLMEADDPDRSPESDPP